MTGDADRHTVIVAGLVVLVARQGIFFGFASGWLELRCSQG